MLPDVAVLVSFNAKSARVVKTIVNENFMEIQREETQLNKRFIEAVKKAFGNHVLPLRDIERVNFCLKGSLNDIGNVLKLV